MGLAEYLREKIGGGSKKVVAPISEEGDRADVPYPEGRSGVRKILGPYRTPATVKEAKLSKEEIEQIENLRGQYKGMLKTLKKYGILLQGVPTFEVIKTHLTPEVLREAQKLEEPTLVIVPPVSRQTMVQAINTHRVEGLKHDTHTYDLKNNFLWNGGKPETHDAWEVTIVTGVQDVKNNETIRGTNYQRAKAWVKKYEEQGVDVMNDARTYLVLMMASLVAGKPIDKKFWTVLNAKNCIETSLVVFGCLGLYHVRLDYDDPRYDWDDIRLRGAVRVI